MQLQLFLILLQMILMLLQLNFMLLRLFLMILQLILNPHTTAAVSDAAAAIGAVPAVSDVVAAKC